jgi:hypothetical protein
LIKDRVDGREKEVRNDIDTAIQGNFRLARTLVFHGGGLIRLTKQQQEEI